MQSLNHVPGAEACRYQSLYNECYPDAICNRAVAAAPPADNANNVMILFFVFIDTS